MSRDLVAWFGPVADFQVEGATVPGAREKFFGCHGAITPPLCGGIAWSFQDGEGRSLPTMASQAGVPPAQLGRVMLGAFSAGGQVVRKLLFDPRDRARVKAVLLSDATYAAWRSLADRIPFVQPQLVEYAAEIIAGSGQLFVATASPSPNFELPTGVEVLRQLRTEIEQRTGRRFVPIDFFGIDPAPEAAYRLGDVILAEYAMEPLGHKHTDIAPQVWQRILLPWLESPRPVPLPAPVPPRPVPAPEVPLERLDSRMVAFGAAFLVGYAGVRVLYGVLE